MANMPEGNPSAANGPAAQEAEAERRRLEQRVRELTEQAERLRKENALLRSERDTAQQSLLQILEKEGLLITAEEIRAATPAHPWLDKVIAQLEGTDEK